MKYMCLVYSDESAFAKFSEAEQQAGFEEYFVFTDSIRKSGNYVAGDALAPTHTATQVRVKNGKAQTTDGPYAETREQLGGYYVISAKDLDEAVAIAARIPASRYGCVEVRPILEMPNN
jgi:hypothetical protein